MSSPSAPRGEAAAGGWSKDLQGLRAIAIALVVAYHAFPSRLPSGFVGVDVFFVLSGFLITGRLVGELRTSGRIDLAGFAARRARRLLPVAAAVLLATLAAARALAPLELVWLREEVRAAAVFAVNFTFADRSLSYLSSDAPSAVLQFWSLAVEAQFYLVWPVVLLLATRARLTGRRLAAALAVLVCASFAWGAWTTRHVQPDAFFLLPSRLWEFGAGALVALVPRPGARRSTAASDVVGWAGLAAIAASAIAFGRSTAYPGLVAVLPVVGAVAVVVAATSGTSRAGPGALLRCRPMQLVGDASYSIYLWHWPVLAFPALRGLELHRASQAALVLVALALGFASHRWIERPTVRARWPVRRPAVGAVAAAGVAALVLLAAGAIGPGRLSATTTVVAATGDPARAPMPSFVPANLEPSLVESVRERLADTSYACMAVFTSAEVELCTGGRRDSRRRVVLFGDSHIAQWFPAFDALGRVHGWRVELLGKSSCPSADVTIWLNALSRPFTECDRWRHAALRRISARPPFAVMISNSRAYGFPGIDRAAFAADWAAGLARTLHAVRPARTVVLADTPQSGIDGPSCLSIHLHDVGACVVPATRALEAAHTASERTVAARADAGYADLNGVICPAARCPPIRGNLLVYRDANHLSGEYVRALTPTLDRALADALRQSRP